MQLTPLLLALLSALLFGLALVLTQFGLRWLPPLRGAGVSVPVSALLFVAISPVTIEWAAWNLPAAGVFAAVGILFPVIVTILTFEANRRLGPNLTGAIGNLAPFFAVVLAMAILGETPGQWRLAGIGGIVLGISLMFVSRGGVIAWSAAALLLPLAAALIRGVVQPAIKLGLEGWPNPFAAALIGYLVSATIVLSAVRIRERTVFAGLNRTGVAWFAAVGLCNGFAVLAMYMALVDGAVSMVAPLVALYPLATVTLSGLFLPDIRLTRWQTAGIVATVVGVALLLTD